MLILNPCHIKQEVLMGQTIVEKIFPGIAPNQLQAATLCLQKSM